MANLVQRAQQLEAEVVLRDRTAEGAESAAQNFGKVGDAADGAATVIERTEKVTASAEKAYERLQRRIDPLAAAQARLERDEKALMRARDFGIISLERYEKNLEQLNGQFDKTTERLKAQEEGNKKVAEAVDDGTDAVQRQEASLSSLANSTIGAVGQATGLATAFVGLKIAQVEALDTSKKLNIALGLLGRVLPIAGVAALALAFVTLGAKAVKSIGDIIGSSQMLAKVQREAELQVEAAITSTGGAAQRTLDDIRAVASEVQNLTNFGDEVTIRAGAQLLTFTNIREENFDRTLGVIPDVAARLNRQPEQVAMQLGKALNDPVKNLSALTESGIQFSDGQRNLIKSLAEVGEVATAQTIILAELENQFKGSAHAARLAEGGAVALANSWGDLKEELGDRIVEKTADDYDRLALAVGDPVWKVFYGLIGDIVGTFKSWKISIQSNFLQGSADALRGIAVTLREIKAAADDLGFSNVKKLADDVASGFSGLLDKGKSALNLEFLPDGALRDNLRAGGPLNPLGSAFSQLRGIGRREREANAAEAVLDADGGVAAGVVSADEKALNAIVDHYQNLNKEAQAYYGIIANDGAAALENHQHQEELLKTIDEITAGLPDHIAKEIKETILATDAIEQKTDALKKQANEVEKLKRAFDPIAALDLDIEQLQGLISAAQIGPDEYDNAVRRFEIEDKIARLKVEAARNAANLDEEGVRARLEKIDALSLELDGLLKLPDDFVTPLEQDLNHAADDFVSRLVREGRLGFREMGRDLKTILLDSVLDPFRNALRNLLNGVFNGGGAFGGIFTPGVAGGQNPAAGGVGAAGGFGGFSLPSFASTALGVGGVALGGAPAAFGALGMIGSAKLGQGAAAVGNFIGLPGGVTDFLSEGLAEAGTLGGMVGGIGGSLLSGAIFGQSTGQSIGSTIGGIAGTYIPIPVLGPLIGSFLGGAIGSLFSGQPSDKVGQAVFDPITGSILGTGQKDGSDASNQNLDVAKYISNSVSESIKAIADRIGADLRDDPSTAYRDDLFNVAVGNRDGIRIGNQGANGEIASVLRFENDEAGAEAAIEAGIRRGLANLSGGDDEVLTGVVRQLSSLDEPIEQVVGRIEAISAVLADPDELANPLRDQIDALIAAFDGLDTSTGALKDAFDKTIDRFAEDITEQTRKALAAQDNPQKAAIDTLLEQQADQRSEIDRLAGLGGNVDTSLVSEFQRREILSQFNIEQRLGQATDPVKYGIDQLLVSQAQEREAFKAAISESDGLVTQADFLGLLRAQEAERVSAFSSLSDEDKIRLSGREGEFTDLESQYALTVDRLLEETERLVDGFESERDRLSDLVSLRGDEINSLDRAIRDLDDLGSPRESVDVLRAQLDDLGNRALNGDEATKAAARAELPDAVQAYTDRLAEVYASGDARANGVDYARDLLMQVRDQAVEEKSTAERQLDALEKSRDTLEQIRDLMAAPRLDIEALVRAASGADPDSPFAVLAFQLADLEARQTAQSERLVSVLEAMAASDVGLGGDADAPFTGASPETTYTGSSNANDQAITTQNSNSEQGSRDGDVALALGDVAHAVDDQTKTIVNLEQQRAARDARIENHLKNIATRRNVDIR